MEKKQRPLFLRMDSPWPWLIYLCLLFWPWAFRPPTPLEIGVALGSLALFLPLYFFSHGRPGWSGVAGAFLIAGLGLAIAPILPSASVYLTYAGALLGWRRSERVALGALGALLAMIALFAWATHQPLYFFAPAMFFPGMIGLSNFMGAQLKHKNEALRAAQAHATRLAAQAERERIARDLHDLLGHTLTVIAVKADLAAKLIETDQKRAASEIADIQRTARRALGEVRHAVTDMKQARLGAEIAQARVTLAAADVRLELAGPLPAIPPHLEQPLAFLIREAVTNVVRHAEASFCRIDLCQVENALRLVIADDGKGGALQEGNGLAGMRARVAELGGAMTVNFQVGAVIEAAFPLPAEAAP